MKLLHKLVPRTLLLRTFLLVSLLIFISVATWIALFALAQREPQARQLGQLAVSVVNLTNAALVAADPAKRVDLLRDLANSEGVHIYPAEPDDDVIPMPDNRFFAAMLETARTHLGPSTRLAASINGQTGIWISFSVDQADEDVYWLMLPGERAESEFPWHWLGWGGASLVLALLVAWLIVSRVTQPLRALAQAASEVGRGRHPDPVPERGAVELRQLAQAFNAMSEDLKRINAERAEVLAGLSHDLRTPLARLRLEAELSIHQDQARDAVIDDIEQMDAVIGQFLDFARGEGGEPLELVDINEIVTQLAEAQGRRSNPLNLTLGPLPPARIHPKALTRAIVNLLENARKYGGETVSLETRIDGGEIQVDVLDRGPGIPQDEVERLKRPFTRLESARTDATGTGLGLAIVERIARLHKGSLELLGRKGGGLIARLKIPA
ncbi:MAG: ATP-binding protein [Propionivibrio sp.]